MRVSKSRRRRFGSTQPIVYKALKVGGALIDEQLPHSDFRDAYQVVVIAPPEAVYDSAVRFGFLDHLATVEPFAVIAKRPGREIVLGAVGRPWRADYGPIRIAANDFAGFEEPGFAKIAWTWIVKPLGSGQSMLVVEWRAQLTDEDARSHFRRYWPGVSRAVQGLARVTLARIKEDCERRLGNTPRWE